MGNTHFAEYVHDYCLEVLLRTPGDIRELATTNILVSNSIPEKNKL